MTDQDNGKTTLLEYESQMFLDLIHEDGLAILAKGLGVERLFLSLLKVYHDPANLVLVIGTTPQEEEYFLKVLSSEEVPNIPKVITNEYSTKERYNVYMDGGVLFVTSRILVVDMLMDRVPIDLITGIIVYRAHKILESCQEAFILRLYRQKNKNGFIKALSSSACAFTHGFCQVQRVMRNLFVKKLYLWPRFQSLVKRSLESFKPEVIEMHVSLTPAMGKIQMALLDLISVTVKEVKKANPTLDTDEVTVENCISKAFDKVIKFQLDPIWHQLASKTKRLVSDLKTLRNILLCLTQFDCVTFYNLVKSVKDSVKVNTFISDWLFLDASETVFVIAKERVLGANKKSIKEINESVKDWKIEENPKWAAFQEVLKEFEKEAVESEIILTVVADDHTALQLQELVDCGPQSLLVKLYNKTASLTGAETIPDNPMPCEPVAASKGSGNEQGTKRTNKLSRKAKLTLTQMVNSSDNDEQSIKGELAGKPDSAVPETQESSSKQRAPVFFALRGHTTAISFQETLDALTPKRVVLYDADMSVVRQLEIYQALHTDFQLKVYFLIYGDSTEEQSYLTTLRREKEAFEFLIREKSSMVIPDDRDGKTDDHPDLIRDVVPANQTVSTRKGGVNENKTSEQRKVIVDLREFRSELPALIHRRGIDIVPVTIEVGDYILTPETCVERKSVSDLIGSLNSGRLYNQAQSMCRYYQRPILLIEFDQNKSFSLQGKYLVSSDSTNNLLNKLVLTTLHFPRLRLLWCPSPYATAEMFELLKYKKPEPDAAEAATVTAQETHGDHVAEKYNAAPQDFLSRMPGITSKNIWSIMNSVKDLHELSELSLERLTEILKSSSHAGQLWDALHKPVLNETRTSAKTKKNIHRKGKRFKTSTSTS